MKKWSKEATSNLVRERNNRKRWSYGGEGEWVMRVHNAHASGILNTKELSILLKREDGYTLTQIGADLGLTKQRVAQLFYRGNMIVRTGSRPKRGRPPLMPEEYTVKLTKRQKSALRNKGLKAMIMEAERKNQPYWTHCLMVVLDQIADQNNTVTVLEEGTLL
jgi:hypothetical protein